MFIFIGFLSFSFILPTKAFEEFEDTTDTVAGDDTKTKDVLLKIVILVVLGMKLLFLTLYYMYKIYKKIKNRRNDSRRTDNHDDSESKV